MAISCLGLGLLGAGPVAHAQTGQVPATGKTKTLYYNRNPVESGGTAPVAPTVWTSPVPQAPPAARPASPSPAAPSLHPLAQPAQLTQAPTKPATGTPAGPATPTSGAKSQVGLKQVGGQIPIGVGGIKDDATRYAKLQYDTPGPERLFRLESYDALKERWRQEARTYEKLDRISFPEEPVLSKEIYQGRDWPRTFEFVEPNYVCFRRTHYDQINLERYGWDLGVVTPIVSTGKFYWDAFWTPYHCFTEPFRHYECNRGYCLPGDPVPLLLYPPHLSLSGLTAQAAAVGAGFAIFPGP